MSDRKSVITTLTFSDRMGPVKQVYMQWAWPPGKCTGYLCLHQRLHELKRKKPAIFSVAGFSMPIRLYLAPRPGLEPGTYGLTAPSQTPLDATVH